MGNKKAVRTDPGGKHIARCGHDMQPHAGSESDLTAILLAFHFQQRSHCITLRREDASVDIGIYPDGATPRNRTAYLRVTNPAHRQQCLGGGCWYSLRLTLRDQPAPPRKTTGQHPLSQHGWGLVSLYGPRCRRVRQSPCVLGFKDFVVNLLSQEVNNKPRWCQVVCLNNIRPPSEGVHPPVESDAMYTVLTGLISSRTASCSCPSLVAPPRAGLFFWRNGWDAFNQYFCPWLVRVQPPENVLLFDLPVILIDQSLHQIEDQ